MDRDGVRIYYEVYGEGEHTLVFAPADVIVTGQMWKAQVPYLARTHRVVVIDPRGNGRSDKPTEQAAYGDRQFVADLVAVMDELGVQRAVLGGLCQSAFYALSTAARHPERVEGVVAVGPWAVEGTPRVDRGTDAYDDIVATFEAPYVGQQEWRLLNRELWLRDWPQWPRFFFSRIINDPHSTKLYEDIVGWACQSTGAAQAAAAMAPDSAETPEAVAELFATISCPVLVIHGTHDFCQPFARGAHIARMVGGELLALGGAGHLPPGRDPVVVNHAFADFLERVHDGTVHQRHGGAARVRAHLSTRRDDAPPLGPGTRLGRGTTYGSGPPAVVFLPALDARDRISWLAQVPGLVRQLPVLVLDDDVTVAEAVGETLEAAGVGDVVLFAPPGAGRLVDELARTRPEVAVVVHVEHRRALSEQPGLLEHFVDRLPRVTAPSAIPLALVDAPAAQREGRVPVVLVAADHSGPPRTGVDAIVTVAGGVNARLRERPPRRHRERRLLYLSSPIGLGHVRRDLAIADALREHVPGLRVDWLSQSPVTDFLQRRGERVHPASAWLANESRHIESEAGEHDLHAFQAIRRMDEILVHNFHVFDDLVREREYDAWVGDEAWDLDHFLHENPRLKRAPFVWMTDFVGWVPMSDGGEHEAALAADYNAEMIEHVARYPDLRDRSIFVGDPEDVVAGSLGPGLPDIRDWTEAHFAFSGYVMGARPDPAGRDRLRARLGYAPDETVCVVSVGGSAVGEPLLRRVVEAYDACRARVPSLRFHVVTGPRLDPQRVKVPDGVTVDGFLPDLDLHHAACDIAVVQGGLSTTMELTAAGRPFVYVPLRHHFEQQVHVRHRLERHRAGRAMDYDSADPDTIADAIAEELARAHDYVPVPEGGAERVAGLVAELL
ncbi:alpha/beta hydrolase [Nocardioides cynanchi]|uniref:alpha/beta hydrolase n=1 Tax=Nocardioides cynanchi TaxID=2558918 RepID=UPI00178044C1|nr:alpha/beta hydrolase [Nocardioides cynanchi]